MNRDTTYPAHLTTRPVVFGLLYLVLTVACPGNAMATASPLPQAVAGNTGQALSQRNLQFTRITPREGLSQAGVNAIVQDQFGMIWLGTQEGLNRYDGHQMVVYDHLPGEAGTLSHDWVWSLHLDKRGVLWAGTDGGGLNRYNRAEDTFTHYRHDPDNPNSLSSDRVRVIYQDAKGVFWIGTDGGGLNRFDQDSGEFTRYRHAASEPDSLPGDTVLAIFEDSTGKLWVGTDHGLARMDQVRGRFVSYRHDPARPDSLSNNKVRSIYEDRGGQIWVGTYEGGLNLLDRRTDSFRRFQHDPDNSASLSHNRVRDIYQDQRGTLWIATDRGLNEWRPEQNGFAHYLHDPVDPGSISDNRLTTLFQDKGGVLWVGTYNGVNKWNYVSDAFDYLQPEPGSDPGLSSKIVTAIAQSPDGRVWVGTYGGGLNRIDMGTGDTTHYRHAADDAGSLSDNRVMTVHAAADNMLWVGSRNGGLDRLDPETGRFTHYRHDPQRPNSLSSNAVTSIHSDDNGILWVGTYGAGLNRFHPASGTSKVYRHDPADASTLSSDRILAIYRDRAGVLWVGTEDGGLNRFDEAQGTFVHYRHDADDPASLGSDAAWNILESRDGSLWVATLGGGLNRWSAEDRKAGRPLFRKHLKTSGLRSDSVFGIVEDQDGFLWLSSNRGLSRLNPVDGSVRNFDRFNGLRGDEFNFGAHLQMHNGRLLFGGSDGVVSFHPDELLVNMHTPDIILTAHSGQQHLATAYSTDQREAETVTLGYKDDYIRFEFAALDYASPDKNQYRYRLEGIDEEWIDPGDFRRASYASLPAGDYTFTVKAANNDGIWNERGASIELRVEPPPWQTAWAYSLYTVFFGGTLVGYRRMQNRKLNEVSEQKEILESEVDARTRELSRRNAQLKSLNEQLMQASVTDSLTGLKNRRFLDEFIDTEVARIDRQQRGIFKASRESNTINISPSLFFMMIDLDGFKGVNDNHGHLAGDRALVQVRDILLASCRQSDTIIRWGGDEFMVIGNTASPHTVEQLAERIRVSLADHQFKLGNGHTGRLSGSIGFAMYPFTPAGSRSLTWEQTVAVADHAAYTVKRNGRNAWLGVYGTKKSCWEELARTNINLPALVRQNVVTVRSSLQKLEEYTEKTRVERA